MNQPPTFSEALQDAERCAARAAAAQPADISRYLCRCDHPHLPGAVWCYLCDHPLADPEETPMPP